MLFWELRSKLSIEPTYQVHQHLTGPYFNTFNLVLSGVKERMQLSRFDSFKMGVGILKM